MLKAAGEQIPKSRCRCRFLFPLELTGWIHRITASTRNGGCESVPPICFNRSKRKTEKIVEMLTLPACPPSLQLRSYNIATCKIHSVTWLIVNVGKWSSSASNLTAIVSRIVNVEQMLVPMILFVTASGRLGLLFLRTPYGSSPRRGKGFTALRSSCWFLQEIRFCWNCQEKLPSVGKLEQRQFEGFESSSYNSRKISRSL